MINTKSEKRQSKREPRMQRTQILLDPIQYKQISELARKEGQSMSSIVRQMLDEALREQKRRNMEKAAEIMAHAYENDKELTAFSALDGEDFIA
jgi:macrodomain Ter protein organizer (MatP/YcbG family)